MQLAGQWLELEITILNEVTQTEKGQVPRVLPHGV